MKLIIAKILIAGSILLGLGVIACENRGVKNTDDNKSEGYTPAAGPDGKTNVDDNNDVAENDSASVSTTDTSYDSTSDTVYRRR